MGAVAKVMLFDSADKIILVLLWLCLVVALGDQAQAAKMTKIATGMRIEGPIHKGDAKKFASKLFYAMFMALAKQRGIKAERFQQLMPTTRAIPTPYLQLALDTAKFPTSVYLQSPGGRLLESMFIAYMVRRAGMHTWGAENRLSRQNTEEFCLSSCAVIWSAGIIRFGWVGYHRPYLETNSIADYAKHTRSWRSSSEVYGWFLRRMGIPQEVINRAQNKRPDDVLWIHDSMFDGDLLAEPGFHALARSKCGAVPTSKAARPRYWSCYQTTHVATAAQLQGNLFDSSVVFMEANAKRFEAVPHGERFWHFMWTEFQNEGRGGYD